MITQLELKEILHYNPDTGIFIWLMRLAQNVKIGDRAGCDSHGYIAITIKSKKYRAHRLAFLYMEGEFPKDQVDHRDRNKSNNVFTNLRHANNAINHKNMSMQANNTSGMTGVSWYKQSEKWAVWIKVNNKNIYLGYHKDFDIAVLIRKAAECWYGFHQNHGRA